MTVTTIQPGRDIKPKIGRITKSGNSGGMTFDQHLQNAQGKHCSSCGAPAAKLYQYEMCAPCIKAEGQRIQRFIDTQRAEILGGR